uniref:DEP domain-containing protein 7 n=1 Tax=Gasterosteus aculeatus aculeatus TaxID=481459 RepID=A0AAQ4PKQ2_GASAC
MATIKERAAALNLAEKLCVRPPARGAASRPAQSSCVWSCLISHLRSSVTVKRRRINPKSHGDCFLSSEAVDTLEEHINSIVSRAKVVRVCQALLDCNVFEAVGTRVFGKVKKRDVFQDSRSAILISRSTDEWSEQTLLRLLNLVELPVLEAVLQCSQAPSPPPPSNLLAHSNPDLIYSSNHLDRQILKVFRDSQEDEWLIAALDCLDFLPDQPVVELSRELPDLEHKAGYALGRVCSVIDRALLRPEPYTRSLPQIDKWMTSQQLNAKLSTALEALQLCLKLLPSGHRDELCALLTFMALAADPQGMKLDKEVRISQLQEDLMVIFLLSNIKDIFMIPGTLHKGVSEKLASLAQGKQPDVTGFTFCQPVSHGAYNESTKKTTNEELRILLGGIHHNPKISAKERKRLLRQFYQAHPEIFNQYFGEHAVSVL